MELNTILVLIVLLIAALSCLATIIITRGREEDYDPYLEAYKDAERFK